MQNEEIFAARVNRIGKKAKKTERARKKVKPRGAGGIVVVPLTLGLFMAGSMVFAWDMMDRPTNSPFEMTTTLTAMVLAYL